MKRYKNASIEEIKIDDEIFYDFENGQEGKKCLNCIEKVKYDIPVGEDCRKLINENCIENIKYKKLPDVNYDEKYFFVNKNIEPYIFYNTHETIIKYKFLVNNLIICLTNNFIAIGNKKIYENEIIYDFCIDDNEKLVYFTIPNYFITYDRKAEDFFKVETKISEISYISCCKDFVGIMDSTNKNIQIYSKNSYNIHDFSSLMNNINVVNKIYSKYNYNLYKIFLNHS